MLTLITLPITAQADLLAFVGDLFTDLWVVFAIVVGIPLAFYIIRRVIGLAKVK